MKAGLIFTGTGPILILTTYESFEDPKLVAKFDAKGIKKFIACDLPLEKVKARYGNQYSVVLPFGFCKYMNVAKGIEIHWLHGF
ncbi:MAG: hypothetical protein KJP05_10595 [Deltaproteobacteria bacterium]|nr:hypothetical protein [Deltaproteobacteria bacterium]